MLSSCVVTASVNLSRVLSCDVTEGVILGRVSSSSATARVVCAPLPCVSQCSHVYHEVYYCERGNVEHQRAPR